MEHSILKSTKKNLGLNPDYNAFDQDIITHLNNVFSDLHQLGIGPDTGFFIEDDSAEWEDFTTDTIQLGSIRTYAYLRIRLIFDPPTTGFHMEALKEQIKEKEWRMSVRREDLEWVNPIPTEVVEHE